MAKIIVFEGIDGCGKTTLAERISQKLGEKAVFLSKKSADAESELQKKFMIKIKSILWEHEENDNLAEIDEESWLYLHMLWYHMFQQFVIRPIQEKYDYIILDGWYYKFLARHIVNKKMDGSVAQKLIKRLITGDKIFWLKVNPEICFERKRNIKLSECGIHKEDFEMVSAERFIKYQKEVAQVYSKMSKDNNFIEINAQNSIDDITKFIMKNLGEL